jgi:8-oxo-dGDP phosphatase
VTFTHEVKAEHTRYEGPIFTVVTDEVTMPGGGTVERDMIRHVGAVGVAALDDAGRIVLVRQYRHPLRRRMWELPAGLRDVEGEPLATTASRELAEEADLTARRWDLLLDVHTSPGFSNEVIRIFLGRDLAEVPPEQRHEKEHEEADMDVARIDLDEAVAMVLRGDVTNGPAIAGILAAARVRDNGFKGLRPA